MDNQELTPEQLKNREELATELNELLQKRKLLMELGLDFPQYKILPPEVQLALQVIQQHQPVFVMKLKDQID